MDDVEQAFAYARGFSHLEQILAEEVIEGKEYSMEGLHFDGRSEVLQFTEKQTTPFPYNVELGHRQPARLCAEKKHALREMLERIGQCMGFEHCASHTEFKINEKENCQIIGNYFVLQRTQTQIGNLSFDDLSYF